MGVLLGVTIGAVLTVLAMSARRYRRDVAISALLDAAHVSADDDGDRRASGLLEQTRRVVDDLSVGRRSAAASANRLEQALDRMADGLVVCDAEGTVVFTNVAASVLADPRHEDALVAAAVDECLRSATAGESATRSVELFGPPARTITVDAQPLGDHRGFDGAVATIADESRLRRLESVRSDFVANVSHELKTPIGGLALLAEALSEAGDADEQRQLAERVLQEAHRVGRVVDDLLALGEIEGDLSPRREPVSVDDLVDRMRGDVALLADGFGVTVDTSAVDAGLAVTGDLVQLASALGNLVENAIKYSGGSTPVTIEARSGDGVVQLAVRDHGIGIPRQDLDRVFERFYRVDQARSRATGGTGLGLAIVRNVVRSHGGEVELESREGEGTTVTIRLPAAPVPSAPVRSRPSTPTEEATA